jgi:DNA-binding IclR family transcriptional regulator
MPPRHHRTVDRVVSILELVARSGRGLSLASISQELGAPKSSVQVLANGLVATGYLVEHDQKLTLGSGPFVLSLIGNRIAAMGLSHELLEELYAELGYGLLVGIGLGDSAVYVDHAGAGPELEFFARNHIRRPLFVTAAGKIILSELPAREMDSFVINSSADEKKDAQAFLAELPTIRATGLAYNLGKTMPGMIVVATPLRDGDGQFVASIAALTYANLKPDIEEMGTRLHQAVSRIKL